MALIWVGSRASWSSKLFKFDPDQVGVDYRQIYFWFCGVSRVKLPVRIQANENYVSLSV